MRYEVIIRGERGFCSLYSGRLLADARAAHNAARLVLIATGGTGEIKTVCDVGRECLYATSVRAGVEVPA